MHVGIKSTYNVFTLDEWLSCPALIETKDVDLAFSQKPLPSLKSQENHMMPTQMQILLSNYDANIVHALATLEEQQKATTVVEAQSNNNMNASLNESLLTEQKITSLPVMTQPRPGKILSVLGLNKDRTNLFLGRPYTS